VRHQIKWVKGHLNKIRYQFDEWMKTNEICTQSRVECADYSGQTFISLIQAEEYIDVATVDFEFKIKNKMKLAHYDLANGLDYPVRVVTSPAQLEIMSWSVPWLHHSSALIVKCQSNSLRRKSFWAHFFRISHLAQRQASDGLVPSHPKVRISQLLRHLLRNEKLFRDNCWWTKNAQTITESNEATNGGNWWKLWVFPQKLGIGFFQRIGPREHVCGRLFVKAS
jgi:hypothetical protein